MSVEIGVSVGNWLGVGGWDSESRISLGVGCSWQQFVDEFRVRYCIKVWIEIGERSAGGGRLVLGLRARLWPGTELGSAAAAIPDMFIFLQTPPAGRGSYLSSGNQECSPRFPCCEFAEAHKTLLASMSRRRPTCFDLPQLA